MDLDNVLPLAREILTDYDLCDNCLGRLFSKTVGVKPNQNLGKKIHTKLGINTKRCYICKNIFFNLREYVELIKSKTIEYQFSNFLVGTIIQPSIVDRDDKIRSKFKLRGIDGIKTDITREISSSFSRQVRKQVLHLSPDLTITLDLKENTCSVNSRPHILFGRYVKSRRGIPQKQKRCDQCLSEGCSFCNYSGLSGFDSVEGIISKYFIEKFHARKTRFTWIGGEDKNSLVKGKGRPFFVKIINPKKRCVKLPPKISVDGIKILRPRIVQNLPKKPINFFSKVSVLLKSNKEINSTDLQKLKGLVNQPITIWENKGRQNKKRIYSIKHRKISQDSLRLTIEMEGGVPIKRLVEGNNIDPCISYLLDDDCRCTEFDFINVTMDTKN
ncbi:MAG: pseudouridine synthase [Nitrosopumilaceae archaeon]|nr:pseudouridine synthase [Nitrosopumilaceae archaeon]NIU00102.1 pseudouridine synthase [Nitrosopumilaceae archaeon]NIU86492.1 pseudouridine synthase [Nitrosopumilaceae archaeon]NIV65727.1 pseudouridine synthase [Nitrosopumilaceae archaeon]NIX60704.1 pseudouridine synthase [Nitrosopumilaceae archaeon]